MVNYKVTDTHVELYFEKPPTKDIKETMIICGWRWFSKKACWSNFKNRENIEMAKALCVELNPKEPNHLLKLDKRELDTADLIVRCNSFYCNLHHDVEDVAGQITLLDKNGNLVIHLVPVAYCRNCNIYFILEETYLSLKKSGIIIHQVMNRKQYEASGSYLSNNDHLWRKQSPLRLWGYSVGKEDDYSDAQRQAILEMIIDKGIMSKDRVLSYLDFFVRMHSGEDAISKWHDDRQYIAKYQLGSARRIRISSIAVHE